MIELILVYSSIWGPAVISIIGIISTVLGAKAQINKLSQSTTLKKIEARLSELEKAEEENIKCEKLLLDKITHIHNYADSVGE